jgi:hypothetical protein
VKVESLKCLQEKAKEEARNRFLFEAEVQDLQAKACDDVKQIANLRTAATKWHDAKRCFQLKQYPKPSNKLKWARIWLGFTLTLVPKLSMYQAEQFVVFLMTSILSEIGMLEEEDFSVDLVASSLPCQKTLAKLQIEFGCWILVSKINKVSRASRVYLACDKSIRGKGPQQSEPLRKTCLLLRRGFR